MIDVKEKRRRTKRKFDESIEKNGCPVRPKETILDMSVSKLAKAKTQLNLEPSLRKTVMIVNTIRKIEEEIENGKGINVNDAMSIGHCAGRNTRSYPVEETTPFEKTTNSTEIVPVRMSMTLERRNEPFAYSESNSERFDNHRCMSFGVVKSDGLGEAGVFDLTKTSHQRKNKLMGKCSYNKLPDREAEINFGEIDISLYDFDATLSWSDGGEIQIACGDLEDNDNVYKTNTGLSALFRRCSDDLKFNKTSENSFTDDLDQIMQVLVGI